MIPVTNKVNSKSTLLERGKAWSRVASRAWAHSVGVRSRPTLKPYKRLPKKAEFRDAWVLKKRAKQAPGSRNEHDSVRPSFTAGVTHIIIIKLILFKPKKKTKEKLQRSAVNNSNPTGDVVAGRFRGAPRPDSVSTHSRETMKTKAVSNLELGNDGPDRVSKVDFLVSTQEIAGGTVQPPARPERTVQFKPFFRSGNDGR
jgi:hypothetical protein